MSYFTENKVCHDVTFYSDDGWGREPITNFLEISGDIVGRIFPKEDSSLCLTLYDRSESCDTNTPIGHCNANLWKDFLEQLPGNIDLLISEDVSDSTLKFLNLLTSVLQYETEVLSNILKNRGYYFDNIIHRCGLMILNGYSGKGLGTFLVKKSDLLIEEKGYLVTVVETTNIASKRVYEKCGYTTAKSFYLKDYGIDIDDYYTVMFKTYT